MRLVVDANVLFALAKPDSVANELVKRQKINLIAPDFALLELHKHKKELIAKSGNSEYETLLKSKVHFVKIEEYKPFVLKALKMTSDAKDAVYIALAMKYNSMIWSNDSHLKEQKHIQVFTTSELIDLV